MLRFKRRSDIHWSRKIWHMAGVSLMALIYTYAPQEFALGALLVVWCLFVPVDVLRQRFPALNEKLLEWFRPIMREYEEKGLAGTSYLLTGVTLVTFLFPREVVLLTLLFLAFADPVASIVGIKYGRTKIFGHKSLEGTFAAFAICTGITFFYLSNHHLLLPHLVVVSLLAGLLGAAAELIPIGKLDDNLTLPLLSALGLSGIMFAFGHALSLGGVF